MHIVNKIRQELKQNSDTHTKSSGKRFFKEKVKIYGVKTALVTKIAKQFDKDIAGMTKRDVFVLCEELWRSEYVEESFVACHFSYLIRKKFKPEDFLVFKNGLKGMFPTGLHAIRCVTIRSPLL